MQSNSDNPKVGRRFQERVCALMQEHFQKEFILEKPIPIGQPPKEHRFDCVSADESIVVECKCYAWTNTGNVPSAKYMGLNQAVLYMSYLPPETKKIIAMKESVSPNKTMSLAEHYCRINGHLLKGIEIAEVDDLGSIRWINC
jgi:hypothetical protein